MLLWSILNLADSAFCLPLCDLTVWAASWVNCACFSTLMTMSFLSFFRLTCSPNEILLIYSVCSLQSITKHVSTKTPFQTIKSYWLIPYHEDICLFPILVTYVWQSPIFHICNKDSFVSIFSLYKKKINRTKNSNTKVTKNTELL